MEKVSPQRASLLLRSVVSLSDNSEIWSSLEKKLHSGTRSAQEHPLLGEFLQINHQFSHECPSEKKLGLTCVSKPED